MFLLLSNSSEVSFNLTITISVILAVVALIAPSITALINNKHIEKMKKMENNHEIHKNIVDRKISILEKYIESVGEVYISRKSYGGNFSEIISYTTIYSQTLIYVSEDSSKLMREIDSIIEEKRFNDLGDKLPELSLVLKDEMRKLD